MSRFLPSKKSPDLSKHEPEQLALRGARLKRLEDDVALPGGEAAPATEWQLAQADTPKPAPGASESARTDAAAAPVALDPEAIVEANPPTVGPLAAAGGGFFGVSTGTAVAAGAGAAAVAASGGGGGGGGDPAASPASSAPAAPVVALSSDTGSSSADKLTNKADLTVSQLPANTTRTFSVDGGAASDTYVAPKTDGNHTVLVTDTNAAGISTSASLTFTIDTVAPTAPAVALVGDPQIDFKEQASTAFTVTKLDAGAVAIVTFTDSQGVFVQARVTGSGSASVSGTADLSALNDGEIKVTVAAVDAAGNLAQDATAIVTATLDGIPTPTVALVKDNGSSNSDGLSNDARLSFSAPPADLATREITVTNAAGAVISKLPTYSPPSTDGAYTVTVVDTDKDGHQATSLPFKFTLDTLAPVAPTVTLATDSGASSTDKLTNNASLNLSTLPAGATRTFAVDGAAASGTYTAPTTDGKHSVLVADTDAAGNASSTTFTFDLDKTAPSAPAVSLSTDSGSSTTDKLTNNAALSFGTLDANTTRTFAVDSAAASGTYTAPTTDGKHSVVVTDTDAAGNASSTTFTFELDKTAPTAPAVSLTADSGSSTTDKVTNNAALSFGTLPSGTTRTFAVNGGPAGSTYTAPTADGKHSVLVTDTDAAGNASSTTFTFDLDKTAPSAPAVSLSTDSGSSTTDKVTNNAALSFGTVDANTTRTFAVDSAAASGTYTAPTTDGKHSVLVTDTDAAGNASSTTFTFDLDKTAPTAPTVTLTTDSGSSTTDKVTNNAALSFGTLPSGTTRTFAVDAGPAASAYTAPTVDGKHSVLVTDTDAAGNTASTTFTFELDKTAPTAPTVSLSTDSGTSATDTLTNNAALSFGTLPANTTRTFAVDSAAASGTYTAPTTDGKHTVVVTDTDAAGNASSTTFTFDLDKTAPAAPAVTLTTDSGSSTTDKVTNNAALSFGTLPTNTTRTFAVDAGAAASTYTAPTVDGTHSVVVTDTDNAGNATSTTFAFTLDKAAPAAPTVSLVGDNAINRTEQPATAFTVGALESGAVASVTFQDVQGNQVTAKVTGTAASSVNGVANLSSLVDGDITITISAQDAAGNSVNGTAVQATLDGIVTPTLSLINDTGISASDAITRDGAVTPSAAPTDLASRTYKVLDASGAIVSSGSNYAAPTTDGRYTVTVTDTDKSGNTATSAPLSFTLDTTRPTAPTIALAVDTGASTTDGYSSDVSGLNVSALAAGNTRVYIVDGGSASSSYSAPTAEGSHTVIVTDIDAAGNAKSTTFNFTLDKTAPVAPTVALANDTGSSATDGYSNNVSALNISPLAANSTRSYKVDTGAAGSTYTAPTTEGAHTVVVTDTDQAGNSTSTSFSFNLDKTAPVAPTVALATDTGSSATDGYSNNVSDLNTSPLAANSTRSYKVDTGAAGSTYTAPTTEGAHTVVVTDTDQAGNSTSTSFSFTLDKTAPVAPTVALATDTGSSATDGDSNNVSALNVSPLAANSTRSYKVDTGTLSSTYTAPTTEGAHTVVVTDTDQAGNSVSTTLAFTLDKTAPTAPTVSLTTDSGTSPTDKVTNNAALTFSAVSNTTTRTFAVDGAAASSSYTAPTADGSHSVVVTDTDNAGNASSTTFTFTLDKTAPSAPTVALVTDSGTSATDKVTNNAALSFGTLPANTTRTFKVDTGATSSTYSPPTQDGAHIVVVTDTDNAGNSTSNTFTFTLDTTVPGAPAVSLTTDSGASSVDKLTNNAALSFGTLDANTARTFAVDSAAASGTYTAPTTDGNHSVLVTDTDAAGNQASSTFTFTLDTTAPATPAISLVNDGGYYNNDLVTNNPGVFLNNQEANARVEWSLDDGKTWVTSINPADGQVSVLARQTDAAGNVSQIGGPLVYTLDRVIKGVPVLNLSTTAVNLGNVNNVGYTVSGMDADAGAYVEFKDSLGAVRYANTGEAGLAGLHSGAVIATPVAMDIAGNTLRGQSVTLTLDVPDTPIYLGLRTVGDKVYLGFSAQIDPAHVPDLTQIDLRRDGLELNVIGIEAVGSELMLTLEEPARSGYYGVTYSTGRYNQLDDNYLAFQTGDTLDSFYSTQQQFIRVAPFITKVSAGSNLSLDASPQGDTIDVDVFFNVPVSFSTGTSSTARPTLTLTLTAPDGTSHDVVATYQAGAGDQPSYSHDTFHFTYAVQAGDVGNWSVKSFNLNGTNVYDQRDPYAPLDLNSLETAKAAFTANGYLYGNHIVTVGASGVATGTSGNEIFVFDNAVAVPAGYLASSNAVINGIKGGAGERDLLELRILLDGVSTADMANGYTALFNPVAKSIEVYDPARKLIKTVAVPQGANWPDGIEGIYYPLVYRNAGGNLVEVANNASGVFVTKDTLVIDDQANPNDLFIQGSYANYTIDVSTAVTLTKGGSRAITAQDRIVIRGEQGNDTIVGHAGVDIVSGGEGNNTISTLGGHDRITLLSQHAGLNTIDGGAGSDTVVLRLKGNQVQTNLNDDGSLSLSSTMEVYTGNGIQTVSSFSEQYNLLVDDATGKITVRTAAGGASTLINVESLTVSYDARTTSDELKLQVGTTGEDQLVSTGGRSLLLGLAGNDVLTAVTSGDALSGGSGNDTLVYYANAGVALLGGDGLDTAVVRTRTTGEEWSVEATGTGQWTVYVRGLSNSNIWDKAFVIQSTFKAGQFLVSASEYNLYDNVSDNQAALATTFLDGIERFQITDLNGNMLVDVPLNAPSIVFDASPDVSVNGNVVTLTFAQAIDIANLPDPRGFVLYADPGSGRGNVYSVTSVGMAAGSSKDLVLTLKEPVRSGYLTVNYADPSRANDTKALQLSDGTDFPSFTAYSHVIPTAPVAISAIRSDEGPHFSAYAGGDTFYFQVDFSGAVAVNPSGNNSFPTLGVLIKAPDGSSQVVQAHLTTGNGSAVGEADTLEFAFDIPANAMGSFSVVGVQLNGATITNAYTSVNANVALSGAVLPILSNVQLLGSHISLTPTAAGAASSSDDLLMYVSDAANLPAGVRQGNFTGVDAGAGVRDILLIQVALPSSVTTHSAAAQYELRHSTASGNVELWHVPTNKLVESFTPPTSANWPVNVEVVGYNPIFHDANGNTGFLNASPVTYSRTTLVSQNADATDFTVTGSVGADVIDVSASISPNNGVVHAVVTSDRILVLGNQGNDTITGHAGVDVINAGVGTNTINAGGGNDIIVLSGGSDTINGGAGTDTVVMSMVGSDVEERTDADGTTHFYAATYGGNNHAEQVTLNQELYKIGVNEATAQLVITDVARGGSVSTLTSIEKIGFTFSDGDGSVYAVPVTMGTSGADNLSTTANDAVLFGLGGNDTLVAGSSGGAVYGGSGDDTLIFSTVAGTTLSGGAGNDTAIMTVGTDLGALKIFHQANSLVWDVRDGQDHTVLRLTAAADATQFTLTSDGLAELGFGTANHWSDTANLSSIENFRVQNSVGTTLITLTLDDVNKTVIPV